MTLKYACNQPCQVSVQSQRSGSSKDVSLVFNPQSAPFLFPTRRFTTGLTTNSLNVHVTTSRWQHFNISSTFQKKNLLHEFEVYPLLMESCCCARHRWRMHNDRRVENAIHMHWPLVALLEDLDEKAAATMELEPRLSILLRCADFRCDELACVATSRVYADAVD